MEKDNFYRFDFLLNKLIDENRTLNLVITALLSIIVLQLMVIIDNKVQNEIYNICGGFEQSNLETVEKIINLMAPHENIDNYLDLHIVRVGQDIRYALNDSKLRALGWSPKKIFDQELPKIVEYYKNNFIW